MTKTIALDRSREVGLGFLYWLTFLTALEPGNILNSDGTLAFADEAVRIAGAAVLGALSAPFVLALMRRFPIERGPHLLRHLTVDIGGAIGLSFVLIAASCLLAPMFGVGDTRPFLAALPPELQANWLLLTVCILAFAAIAQRLSAGQPARPSGAQLPVAATTLRSVEIKIAGGCRSLLLTEIDWIETQGNYLALHTSNGTHLIRETLSSFASKIDPAVFVRIHRRTLVALDRVGEVESVGADASLRLRNGAQLRVSRTYAKQLKDALRAR